MSEVKRCLDCPALLPTSGRGHGSRVRCRPCSAEAAKARDAARHRHHTGPKARPDGSVRRDEAVEAAARKKEMRAYAAAARRAYEEHLARGGAPISIWRVQ